MGYWITTKYGNHVYIDDEQAGKYETRSAIEKASQELGVTVDLRDKTTAAHAVQILKAAKAAGYDLPVKITDKARTTLPPVPERHGYQAFSGSGSEPIKLPPVRGTSAYYVHKYDLIRLKEPKMTDPERIGSWMRAVNSKGNASGDVLIHELAHHFHYGELRKATGATEQEIYFGSKRFSKPEHKEIAMRVSRYAATNPLEFVAETFAGRQARVKYDKEVMEVYKFYHGPEIKLFKAKPTKEVKYKFYRGHVYGSKAPKPEVSWKERQPKMETPQPETPKAPKAPKVEKPKAYSYTVKQREAQSKQRMLEIIRKRQGK